MSVDVTEVRERLESWLATPVTILGLPASGVCVYVCVVCVWCVCVVCVCGVCVWCVCVVCVCSVCVCEYVVHVLMCVRMVERGCNKDK